MYPQGAKLHYVEAGCPDHPLMICLHGFLDCWVGWRFQIAALAPHFRLLEFLHVARVL